MKRWARKFRLGDMTFGVGVWQTDVDHGCDMFISHKGWYFPTIPVEDLDYE